MRKTRLASRSLKPLLSVERRFKAKQGLAVVLTLLCFLVALTLPSTLVSCSRPGQGYAEGFDSWRVMAILSSVVVIPLLIVTGIIASFIRTTIQIPGKVLLIAIPAGTLAIALITWLTPSHVKNPSCFP